MSATAIAWIVSVFFIVILIAGFFVGFWRGLKKSTANLIFSVVGILVAFFVTPAITNAIMGIQVTYDGQPTTLNQMLVEMLRDDQTIASLIDRNPNIATLIQGLPGALANTVVFILVTLAIELVIYIIYRIVASTALKPKEDESKHRWWGAGVGLVKTFLLTLFAFMPLAGLIGVYDTLKTNESFMVSVDSSSEMGAQNLNASIIADNVPTELDEILTGLENNALIKICGVFGLDNATFDYFSKVKVEDNNVYIRKEIETIYPIANFVYQMQSEEQDITFANFDYEKLEEYVNSFVDGGLFKGIVVDLANDIIQNYQEYSFLDSLVDDENVREVFSSLQTSLAQYSENHVMLESYFIHDVKEMFSTVKVLGQSGMLDQMVTVSGEDSLNQVLDILVADSNITTSEEALNSALDVNIVRDAIGPITKIALQSMLEDVDDINTDTSTWSEQDWDDLSSSVVNLLKDYRDLSQDANIMDVVSDPTILIGDEYTSAQLTNALTGVGSLIDEIRSIKLFQTTSGGSIIDRMLEENNITLPQEPVKDAQGQSVTIDSYSGLFDFLSPVLVTVKENDLYDIFNNTSDTLSMMSSLANVLSQEGNENLLSEVILPLTQVEPTKTLIVDEMIKTIQNDIVDFSTLNTYEDWQGDLNYISNLLVTLNTLSYEGTSYLEYALKGEIDTILNNVSAEELPQVIKPVLYAKSTSNLKTSIFDSLVEIANSLTGGVNTIDLSAITLVEGNSEDQADEICEVFASFIAINESYTNETLRNVDKTLLGDFLTSMQQNAYRVTLAGKSEEGVFKGIFDNFLQSLKDEYAEEIAKDTSGRVNEILDETNYPNIDFTELFELLSQLEQL